MASSAVVQNRAFMTQGRLDDLQRTDLASGIYTTNLDTKNLPVKTYGFLWCVWAADSSWMHQIFMPTEGAEIYRRLYNKSTGGIWSAWGKLALAQA